METRSQALSLHYLNGYLVVLINGCLEKGAKVSESALLQDKITDEPREVDILIETHTPGYPVTIAIEVIDRNRRAGTP